jgi:hypothetical protein
MMGINDWNVHIKNELDGALDRIAMFSITKSPLSQGLKLLAGIFPRHETGIEIENGSYYSRQNDSLKRNDVRHLIIDKVFEEYAKFVKKIIDTCAKEHLSCFFVNQPTGYQPQATEELRSRFWATPPPKHFLYFGL